MRHAGLMREAGWVERCRTLMDDVLMCCWSVVLTRMHRMEVWRWPLMRHRVLVH
jgi:hypothetical protein